MGIKPWLKMWTEWIHDPKMLDLTLAEAGLWWKLVTLAQECGNDGRLTTGSGRPLSLEEIANCVHLRAEDNGVLKTLLEKMKSQGSFHWESDILVVTKFAMRQSLAPSDTKEAIKDRVRRHRGKIREADPGKKAVGVGETLPANKKSSHEVGVGETLPERKKSSQKHDPAVAEIFKEMRNYLGYCGPGERVPDPIPNYGKEGQAIKRMLTRGFTRDEILSCWKGKVDSTRGNFVSLVYVNQDIGKKFMQRSSYGQDRRHTEAKKQPSGFDGLKPIISGPGQDAEEDL